MPYNPAHHRPRRRALIGAALLVLLLGALYGLVVRTGRERVQREPTPPTAAPGASSAGAAAGAAATAPSATTPQR